MKKVLAFLSLFSLLCGQSSANMPFYDSQRQLWWLATEEISGIHYPSRVITDSSGNTVEWDDSTRIGTIPHEHSGHGDIHFHIKGIVADYRCIVIDLSDTINWPHTTGVAIHIDYLDVQIDADATGEYDVELWTVDNCDATDCDSMMVWGVSGSRQSGNNAEIQVNWGANGPVCIFGEGGVLSTMTTLNDTTYNTATNLCTTLDPGTADTPPGDGDLIMYVDWIAGTIDLNVNISYHVHTADHE